MSPSHTEAPILLAGFLSLAAGILLADAMRSSPVLSDDSKAAHAQPSAGAKAPIQEVLHCPLAFAGVHLLKDLPEHAQVAYHYCKPVNADVSQCLLYDGTDPDARLIGIEYLVTSALYQKMPAEEGVDWHDHLSLTGVFVLAALAVADEPRSPARGQPKVEVKLEPQRPSPIPSPHASPVRTSVARDESNVVYVRGGTYAEDSPTPASRFDHQQACIDFWLKFIGVKEVHTLVVEGTTWGGKEKGEERIARGQAEAKKLVADF